MTLTLTTGWYAAIFGSGMFATGTAVAPQTLNGSPANANGVTTYGLHQPDGAQSFFSPPAARFFVVASVPEPSSIVMAAMAIFVGLVIAGQRDKTGSGLGLPHGPPRPMRLLKIIDAPWFRIIDGTGAL